MNNIMNADLWLIVMRTSCQCISSRLGAIGLTSPLTIHVDVNVTLILWPLATRATARPFRLATLFC